MNTSGHDIGKSEESEGRPVSAGDEGPNDGRTQAPPETPRVPRSISREQLVSIAASSLLVLAVVAASLKWGFHTKAGRHEPIPMSAWVFYPLLGSMVIGTVAPLWGEMWTLIAGGFGEKDEDSDPHEFRPLPERLLRTLVYLLSAAIVVALVRLVSLTGGFTTSPFTPLLTAPAAIGAFMAFNKYTTIQLTAVGIASVWVVIYLLHHSSPQLVQTVSSDPASASSQIAVGKALPLEAGRWVFGAITSSLLAIAGILSYVRHKREAPRKMKKEHGGQGRR